MLNLSKKCRASLAFDSLHLPGWVTGIDIRDGDLQLNHACHIFCGKAAAFEGNYAFQAETP
jgi:hypothetical protein